MVAPTDVNLSLFVLVSALNGDGIDDLKQYLLNSAKPSAFDVPSNVFSDEDPRETVRKIVKAKFLDILSTDIPYKINPMIQSWSMDNGVLRMVIQVCNKSPSLHNSALLCSLG